MCIAAELDGRCPRRWWGVGVGGSLLDAALPPLESLLMDGDWECGKQFYASEPCELALLESALFVIDGGTLEEAPHERARAPPPELCNVVIKSEWDALGCQMKTVVDGLWDISVAVEVAAMMERSQASVCYVANRSGQKLDLQSSYNWGDQVYVVLLGDYSRNVALKTTLMAQGIPECAITVMSSDYVHRWRENIKPMAMYHPQAFQPCKARAMARCR